MTQPSTSSTNIGRDRQIARLRARIEGMMARQREIESRIAINAAKRHNDPTMMPSAIRTSQSTEPIIVPPPGQTERTASLLRSYRRDLAACNANRCDCKCRKCHLGPDCEQTRRIHTPNHKPQYPVIHSDPLNPCRQCGMIVRHRHMITCRDSNHKEP